MVTIPISAVADSILYKNTITWGMGGGGVLVIAGFALLTYADATSSKEEHEEKEDEGASYEALETNPDS